LPTKFLLLAGLAVLTSIFLTVWFLALRRAGAARDGANEPSTPTARHLGIGFITNFWDTFGIGSFATTTAAFKFWKVVRDEQIPGTLNVGHTVPTVMQAWWLGSRDRRCRSEWVSRFSVRRPSCWPSCSRWSPAATPWR
jgi:hypothetical protein